MTRSDAVKLRRRGETTVQRIVHEPLCLFSDGTIIPVYPCTCGSKRKGYYNVLSTNTRGAA